MSRLTIELPSVFQFTAEIPIRVIDINYGGHVGNDSILSLMQEARLQFYRHLGFRSEISLEDSIGQIVTDSAIIYKSESFLGDVLLIQVATGDFTKYGFDMCYRITNKASGKEVAIGKTGIVCFDYAVRKIARIPPHLLSKLRN